MDGIGANDPRIASAVPVSTPPTTTKSPATNTQAGLPQRDTFTAGGKDPSSNLGGLVNGQLQFRTNLLAGNFRAVGWLKFMKEMRQVFRSNG